MLWRTFHNLVHERLVRILYRHFVRRPAFYVPSNGGRESCELRLLVVVSG